MFNRVLLAILIWVVAAVGAVDAQIVGVAHFQDFKKWLSPDTLVILEIFILAMHVRPPIVQKLPTSSLLGQAWPIF